MMEEKKQEERGVSRRMAAGTVLAAAAGILPQAEDICAAELDPLFSWEKIHREDMIFSESTLQNP